MDNMMNNNCGCMHHKMMPTFIMLFGLTFLLGNLGILSGNAVGYIWPIIIIAAGAMKLTNGMCKCC